MIKRILVALDVDADTPVATRFAANIARRSHAQVVGLAVVDTGNIEAGSRGAGIGSMYYAEKLREGLTQETREKARDLIREFEAELEKAGIEHSETVKEGLPFRRIIEDMKYHDLLVVGRDPHFFYGHPQEKTKTLARVVKEASAPAIVVGEEYHDVNRVLLAYDGSMAAARTIQYFVHLLPFGADVSVEVIHIHEGKDDESQLLLNLLGTYYEKHGISLRKTSMRGDSPAEVIADYAQSTGFDLVVAGAHSVSKIKEWTFGSTTAALLETCPKPLFLHH